MDFFNELATVIKGWNQDPIEDELLFVNFRCQFIDNMTCQEAFERINQTVEILLRESDEFTSLEILEVIISLARKSETTEIPAKIENCSKRIEYKFAPYGEYAKYRLSELLRYYRISKSHLYFSDFLLMRT